MSRADPSSVAPTAFSTPFGPLAPGWGGARRGAGRKRTGTTRVPHRERPRHPRQQPIHATLRARPLPFSLRRRPLCDALVRAIARSHKEPSFHVVHFSVQTNHIHLIVEAAGTRTLSRGMQGLAIRFAQTCNRLYARRGSVFGERYHARELTSARQVRNALVYVLQNRTKYRRTLCGTADPYSSAQWFTGWARPPLASTLVVVRSPVAAPRTWLAAVGWRRHGRIDPDERPRAALGDLKPASPPSSVRRLRSCGS